MIGLVKRWVLKAVRGPGAWILAAVAITGMCLVGAGLLLVNGLNKSNRLQVSVSDHLVPASIQVTGLVTQILESQEALEAYLLTGDAEQRERFNANIEMVHITLANLQAIEHIPGLPPDPAEVAGVARLLGQLESQAKTAIALHDRPDNVEAAYLLNTRGEKLLLRFSIYSDMLRDIWLNRGAENYVSVSSLTVYEDGLIRMMSNIRGYLFLQEPQFKTQFNEELLKNQRLHPMFATPERNSARTSRALLQGLVATRNQLLDIFNQAFAARDKAEWRSDLFYYRSNIAPVFESLKWGVSGLAEATNRSISQVSVATRSHGLLLSKCVVLGGVGMGVFGLVMAWWVRRSVGVYTRRIGEATEVLGGLTGQFHQETSQQTEESARQVQGITAVQVTLGELKESFSQIRSQSEEMARQTDAASLECVQGMDVLHDFEARMGAILGQVREITQAMEEAKIQTRQMDGILALLNELVDQTKLLSFNATIEAEGAGAAGQRFAVVAKQVRQLATRAREATHEIQGMIRQVQQTAELTLAASERGTSAANQGEQLMSVVTERLNAVVSAVSQVSDMAGTVFLATHAQDRSVAQVGEFIQEARETADRVSRRSEQSLATVERLQNTTRDLSRLVGKTAEDAESGNVAPDSAPGMRP